MSKDLPAFPNYLQLRERSRIPPQAWAAGRALSVSATLGFVALLFAAPQTGLFAFWQLAVPLLPLTFWLAPGLWRNLCPLAALNQTPRVFGFSLGRTVPPKFAEYGYVAGTFVFFAAVASRKWLFNADGAATGALLALALAGAFLGGWLFKGKSGWCSSVCPLYPLQRLYNQTPAAVIANTHCTPCLGCTKNCYDFNPKAAYLADLYDEDRYYVNYRKFFAAALPGFLVAYFTLPNAPAIAIPELYAQFALHSLVSVGAFFALDAFLKVSANKLTALFAAAAIDIFYGFGLPPWLKAAGGLFGLTPPDALTRTLQAMIVLASLVWLWRTYRKEPLFLQAMQKRQEETRVGASAARVLKQAAQQEKIEVAFADSDVRVLTEAGRTLLEVAEANDRRIESGCRMGMCGSDPVLILEGMEHLTPVAGDERETLQRLGFRDGNVRLACMCRVQGPVSVDLHPRAAPAASPSPSKPKAAYDRTIRSVAIIGNGIAGVTAADQVRALHPDCEIHLVGRERHHLYNRMAITRLIYGRSAMSRLYLQPDAWYEERKIACWLNTQVKEIDRRAHVLVLATGERLPYDRLILASGSSSHVPPIVNFGLPGTFALREADEAMQVRAFVQSRRCHKAVIAGGGLLGVEVGYAMHKLGLDVTVLERGEWLLRRQLDERGSHFLRQYLLRLGLDIVLHSEAESVEGEPYVRQTRLKDGRILPCDLFVVAAGIAPNAELARASGLAVGRGVTVDQFMRTSDPDIFAAGDVCEFNGQVAGLWPVAVEQARVAAVNALGGREEYRETAPAIALKVVGVDLLSIGRTEADAATDLIVVQEEPDEHRYRKLIVADDRVVGAILLGYPQDAPAVVEAVKRGMNVKRRLDALRAGKWEILREPAAD